MKFKDLKFGEINENSYTRRAVCYFDNGFGASILQYFNSLDLNDSGEDVYTLLILEPGDRLCYDTIIANDGTIEDLTPEEIDEYLEYIPLLEPYDYMLEVDIYQFAEDHINVAFKLRFS